MKVFIHVRACVEAREQPWVLFLAAVHLSLSLVPGAHQVDQASCSVSPMDLPVCTSPPYIEITSTQAISHTQPFLYKSGGGTRVLMFVEQVLYRLSL